MKRKTPDERDDFSIQITLTCFCEKWYPLRPFRVQICAVFGDGVSAGRRKLVHANLHYRQQQQQFQDQFECETWYSMKRRTGH